MHTNSFTHLPCPPLASAPYYEYSSVSTPYSCSTGPKIDQRTSEFQIEAKCPLKIPSILFTSQRWQWPAKRLHFHALCKANSYFIWAAYFVWGGGCVGFPVYSGLRWWELCGCVNIVPIKFEEWPLTRRVLDQKFAPMLLRFLKECRSLLKRENEEFQLSLICTQFSWVWHILSASAGMLLFFSKRDYFFPRSKTEFLFPCSTVIPCVCLRVECALGSFQHLWDRAGRRRHSDFCSRMPRLHPLG